VEPRGVVLNTPLPPLYHVHPSAFQCFLLPFNIKFKLLETSASLKKTFRVIPNETRLITPDEEDPNESRYLGQNSIAAFLSEETRAGEPSADGEQDVIRKDIMPILGLQISTAPYPFMSKEHMDKIRLDIAAALPSDKDVLK